MRPTLRLRMHLSKLNHQRSSRLQAMAELAPHSWRHSNSGMCRATCQCCHQVRASSPHISYLTITPQYTPTISFISHLTDAHQRIRLTGVIIVMYTPQQGPPQRMYMLVADKDGVAGVTVWGDTVNQLMGTSDVIGRTVNIPNCSMSFYNNKRSLNVQRNHVIHFTETSPHAEWWAAKLLAESVSTQSIKNMPDNSVVNLFCVCASIRRDEKTQGNLTQNASPFTINNYAADGRVKIVAVWTMADEHGEVEVRDWSGATYQDSDYVDKTIRLRRVRVSSAPNSVKMAEFMPGKNGTKCMVAPHNAMMRWWLGDKPKQ
jgi:hypothetical protein